MKYQSIKSFEKALSEGSSPQACKIFLMIQSQDSERLDSFKKIIQAISPSNPTVERFAPDVELHLLFDSLLSPSLFGGDPIVVLDGCEGMKKKETEIILAFLEKNPIAGYLILGSRGKTPFSKLVEKIGTVLDMTEEKPWDKDKRIRETLSDIAQNEGKRLSPDAIPLLIEQLGYDVALLSQEMMKLVCYVGDRPTIERSDIFLCSSAKGQQLPWQIAEELVWEGRGFFDPASFHPLLFSIRVQLQIGLKINSLLEHGVPFSEWSAYFPKVWPKTLEKRRDIASAKGSIYFQNALALLFKIESLSRTDSTQTEALFDLLKARLHANR
jgi:DNA polymerase-3 subunit delta